MFNFSVLLAVLFTGEALISERMPMVYTIWLHLSRGVFLFSGAQDYNLSMGDLHSMVFFQLGVAGGEGSMQSSFNYEYFFYKWSEKRYKVLLTVSTFFAKSTTVKFYPISYFAQAIGTLFPQCILHRSILALISAAILAMLSLCSTNCAKTWLLNVIKSILSWCMAFKLNSCCAFSTWYCDSCAPFRFGEGESLSMLCSAKDSCDCNWISAIGRIRCVLYNSGTDSFREMLLAIEILSPLDGVTLASRGDLPPRTRFNFSLEAVKILEGVIGVLAGENFSGRIDLGSLMLTSAGYTLLLSEIFQEGWTFLQAEIWLMLLMRVLYI